VGDKIDYIKVVDGLQNLRNSDAAKQKPPPAAPPVEATPEAEAPAASEGPEEA
jgi:hypothetical protein